MEVREALVIRQTMPPTTTAHPTIFRKTRRSRSQQPLKPSNLNCRREKKTYRNWRRRTKDWKWVEMITQVEQELKWFLIIINSHRFLQASQKELADLSQALENERYRAERLEVQVNDLTELHQVMKSSAAVMWTRQILSFLSFAEWNRELEANYRRYGGEGSISERWEVARCARSSRELYNEGKSIMLTLRITFQLIILHIFASSADTKTRTLITATIHRRGNRQFKCPCFSR